MEIFMDYNFLSPYVRRAWHSVLEAPFMVKRRITLDYELIFVADGKCHLEIGKNSYICEKNDIIFIRPGVEHKISNVANINFTQPHVHFDMIADEKSEDVYVCYEKYEALSEHDKKLLRKDITDIQIPEVFRLENIEYFRTQLYELIELFEKKDKFYRLLCKEKMIHILYLILSEFDTEKTEPENNAKIDMLNIKSYIDGNYTQKITLETLSEQFYVSRFYIEKNFKKYFGIPTIKYYNRVRFEKACHMLSRGKRVSDISEKLGFDNIFSFSRFFKNICGISPSEYRKRRNVTIE